MKKNFNNIIGKETEEKLFNILANNFKSYTVSYTKNSGSKYHDGDFTVQKEDKTIIFECKFSSNKKNYKQYKNTILSIQSFNDKITILAITDFSSKFDYYYIKNNKFIKINSISDLKKKITKNNF